MKAWHFFGDTLRDGTLVPADGVKLKYNGPLKLCQSGLHFSLEPWDALQYAPGANLGYVEVADDSIMGDDKGLSRDAVRYATRDVAWNAAKNAAWNAAKNAARDVAWNAKLAEQRKTFNRMVYDAFGFIY